MIPIQSIGYEDESLKQQAEALAEQLSLVVEKEAVSGLFLTADHLALKSPPFALMFADFQYDTWKRRKEEGRRQGLIKACKPQHGIKIIDATAGWGRDAAILASFGAEVIMLERHPLMAALLRDALGRQSELDKQQLKLSLFEGHACSFLANLAPEEFPDVIYIDPMHPERSKSALVKKEMQVLQQLMGADAEANQLISMAKERAKRVVVKWPQKSEPLLPADASIQGKTVRFDLYTRVPSKRE